MEGGRQACTTPSNTRRRSKKRRKKSPLRRAGCSPVVFPNVKKKREKPKKNAKS
jgi:hypothetical protein